MPTIRDLSAIIALAMAPDGRTLIDDTRLTENGANSKRPVLALDSRGHVHIVWQDRRTGGTGDCAYNRPHSLLCLGRRGQRERSRDGVHLPDGTARVGRRAT